MAYSTVSSKTLAEASRKSRLLYYRIIKSIPVALEKFNITESEKDIRAIVKNEFMKNQDITDIDVIDYLNFRGRLELEEVNMMWRQKPHLLTFLTKAQTSPTRVTH